MMREFVFILGKNLDLSIAEIVSYFKKEKTKFSILEKGSNFLVIRLDDKKHAEKVIAELGGTIKIGEVLYAFEFKGVDNAIKIFQGFDLSPVFSGLPNKVLFGVSSYGLKDWKMFAKIIKKRMKEEGIKSNYFNIPKERSWMTHVEIIKKGLIKESAEFLICRGKNLYIGKTLAVHNPFEFQKRDVERPYQRTIFSIPPRLARIMVNLSMVRERELLVDPFCGIGGILQEALLDGINILGFDIDKKCVKHCIKNLEWLSREYSIGAKNFGRLVKNANSMDLSSFMERNSVDAFVTEPYLGPPFKARPRKVQVLKLLKQLDVFYGRAVREMIKILKPGKRIVIVSPCFRIGKKIEGVDIEKIIKGIEHGKKARIVDPLKKYGISHKFPLYDFEPRHITLRRINVIEKLY